MAPVVFAREWRAEVDWMIANEPGFAADVLPTVERLNDPRAPTAALDDVVSQPWREVRRDWYDAAGLVEVGLHLQAGWCVFGTVDLGALAGPDRDTARNHDKLQALPSPYAAWFDGSTRDCDGWFDWTEPVRIRHDQGAGQFLTVEYPPSGVPLEVGHTEPETTIWHLRREGGVARWPYRASRISLLLVTCPTARSVPLRLPSVVDGARRLPPPPLKDERTLPQLP